MIVQEYKEEIILGYVRDHPGCTKTEVINFMDGILDGKKRSSPLPTHKMIKRLIAEKKIISRPDKENSQIHHLLWNNENKFNIIYHQLSEIDTFIESMNETVRKVYFPTKEESTGLDRVGMFDLYSDFFFAYRGLMEKMFETLWVEVGELIHSKSLSRAETTSQILFTKIVGLMLKFTIQYYTLSNPSEFINSRIERLENILGKLETEQYSISIIDTKTVTSLIGIVDNFKKDFNFI